MGSKAAKPTGVSKAAAWSLTNFRCQSFQDQWDFVSKQAGSNAAPFPKQSVVFEAATRAKHAVKIVLRTNMFGTNPKEVAHPWLRFLLFAVCTLPENLWARPLWAPGDWVRTEKVFVAPRARPYKGRPFRRHRGLSWQRLGRSHGGRCRDG